MEQTQTYVEIRQTQINAEQTQTQTYMWNKRQTHAKRGARLLKGESVRRRQTRPQASARPPAHMVRGQKERLGEETELKTVKS